MTHQETSNHLSGDFLILGDSSYIVKDEIYKSLINADPYCQGISSISKKLFEDHIPVGKLDNLSDELKDKLDNMLRTKHNMTTLAAESCIMFLNNKTLNWLNS
ncbi:hypothetical protein MAR_038236 [Mya arenaria]|uniref:Uncharacterized protein n=1 Tax=Mya arenaria TaxID=6604 RepID=A0ABY7FU41_MYAAR|nr:hypothetical protein MAR_038236 [Mya arenaria]